MAPATPIHMSQGEPEPEHFRPDSFIRQRHPDVRVEETDLLPNSILGGVDHEKRIIWLARGLSEVQRRCTLAYEIAQFQQGPTPTDPCLAAAYRRVAEDWAALMLVPSEAFVDAWAACLDLAAMAARVGVDLQMFRARIRAASDADQDAAIAAIEQTRLSA